jgi:hypothetical protein
MYTRIPPCTYLIAIWNERFHWSVDTLHVALSGALCPNLILKMRSIWLSVHVDPSGCLLTCRCVVLVAVVGRDSQLRAGPTVETEGAS